MPFPHVGITAIGLHTDDCPGMEMHCQPPCMKHP
jgi:hypothetical protein